MRQEDLPAIDITSSTWAELKRYLSEQERLLLAKLRNPDTNPVDTSVTRGDLRRISLILGLEEKIQKSISTAF